MFSLIASGLVPIHSGIAFVMGANIGTTIDAFLATLIFPGSAVRVVAYSHIIFNIIGVSILFPIFLFFRKFIH